MNEGDRKRQQEVMALARKYEQELLAFARSRNFNVTIHDLYPVKKPGNTSPVVSRGEAKQPSDTLVHQEIQQLREMLEEKLSTLIELLTINTTNAPEQMQPIINVNLDTGAISQAFLFGLNTMLDRQTDTLSTVIREVMTRNQTVESKPEIRVREVSATVSEPSPEAADRQIIKDYLLEHPDASVRETAREVGMGKTKVGDIMKELKGS